MTSKHRVGSAATFCLAEDMQHKNSLAALWALNNAEVIWPHPSPPLSSHSNLFDPSVVLSLPSPFFFPPSLKPPVGLARSGQLLQQRVAIRSCSGQACYILWSENRHSHHHLKESDCQALSEWGGVSFGRASAFPGPVHILVTAQTRRGMTAQRCRILLGTLNC